MFSTKERYSLLNKTLTIKIIMKTIKSKISFVIFALLANALLIAISYFSYHWYWSGDSFIDYFLY